MTKELEVELFRILAIAHLKAGGELGIKDDQWYRATPDHIAESPKSNLEMTHQFIEVDGATESGRWNGAEATVNALMVKVSKMREELNNVVFFRSLRPDGVTWRMLKIDMAYLRAVVGGDSDVMANIIKRLSAVVTEVMQQEDKPEEEE